ncbi:MAG: DNA cytosine methyltransferase [Thermomicrobiales bacterium]
MRSIELFAGAGGLAMGLHEAGFVPISVVEWDRYCCDTLRENQARGSSNVRSWPAPFQGDVRDVNFTMFEDQVDLISGGPPCQPFSLGGKHQAHGDLRDMFPEAIRAVRQARPRAFIFENVKGLTRATFRNYFEYIRLQMEHPEITARVNEDWSDHLTRLERHHTRGRRDGLHYRVVTRVLNAANYGIPQRRERVIFVGFRADLHIDWSFPEETHSRDALIWDQTRGSYWERHNVPRVVGSQQRDRAWSLTEKPVTLPWVTVRDAVHDLPDPEKDLIAAGEWLDHRFQPGARSYPGHTGSPLDEPAKTLKAGVHGVPGGENMIARADGSVRYFTIRESARLQTFPDDFLFRGSWSETMRQLGNAVPVRLASVVGRDVAWRLGATS